MKTNTLRNTLKNTFGTTTTRSIHRLTFGTVDTFQISWYENENSTKIVLVKYSIVTINTWFWYSKNDSIIYFVSRRFFSFCLTVLTWHSYWPASRADTYFIWNILIMAWLDCHLCRSFIVIRAHAWIDILVQFTSVFQPTFRVQRLSFAFFKETKRSSEMNVSSSTCRQRQRCQRCEN